MEQARRPKLRDLPLEERYEMYLKIEYQHALDDFILMLGLGEDFMAHVRDLHRWDCMYMNFLSRILKEHSGNINTPSLNELREQIEETGLECELAYEGHLFGSPEGMENNCVRFTVGGMKFTLVKDWAVHSLYIDPLTRIDGVLLRMPTSELIECIRQSIPFIPRIMELAEEAEKDAPRAAMVRRIRRMTKKKSSLQDSSDTKV